MKKNAPNFQVRIIALIIFTFIPIYGLVGYTYVEQLNNAHKTAIENQSEIVNFLEASQTQLINNTRSVLTSLAEVPVVNNESSSSTCNDFLADILSTHPEYLNIGVANLDGLIICSGVPLNMVVDLGDRDYFTDAIETRDLSIGTYQIGRVTGKSSLNFGYPLINDNNEVTGIIYAALDIKWLNNLLGMVTIPEGSAINVMDTNGNLLVRFPNPEQWVGKNIKNDTIAEIVLESSSAGVVETEGLDGKKRFYTYDILGDKENPSAYIWSGVEKEVLDRDAAILLQRNLISLVIVNILALLIGWLIGRRLIINRVQAIQEIDRAKDEFISIASHQLRTPLTAIRLYLEILESNEVIKKNKELSDGIEIIQSSTIRMIKLVGDILNVSRLQLGSLKINPQPTQIEELVTHLIEELKPSAKERNIEVEVVLPERLLPKLNIDSSLIHQVIHNLVTNALRYSHPNSGRVVIEVKASINPIGAEIIVQDNGIGIPTKEASKIFSRFFRAENAVKHNGEGTGLGMYLAKMIIDLAGGKIWFDSKINEGTTFHLVLPQEGMVESKGIKSLN